MHYDMLYHNIVLSMLLNIFASLTCDSYIKYD